MDAIGGYVDPFQGMPTQGAGIDAPGMIPEVTKLREWESKHEEELEEKSRQEEAAKKESRQSAAEWFAQWYAERKGDQSKRAEVNRAQEKDIEGAGMAGANPWERVVDLIDTNSRTADESRDTTRMRSLLIQLKSNLVVTSA